jgi:hypothetical protein
MKTAKEIAFKAFMENVIVNPNEGDLDMMLWKARFESWWSEWVTRGDHKDKFTPELSVFIEGKRYIQAE